MTRRLLLAALALAAAGTLGVFDADGQRIGTARQEGSRLDLFDAHSRRVGWGRCDGQGRCEMFDTQGRRIGETRDGRVILTDPALLQRKETRP